MAVVTGKLTISNQKTGTLLWETLTQNDTGSKVLLGRWADKTIQVIGTFGVGAAVIPQGSPDGTTWGALNDGQGTTISITDNVPVLISENPTFIRLAGVGGDGNTDLDVTISFAVK